MSKQHSLLNETISQEGTSYLLEAPLAERARPTTLEEVVGQSTLLAPGTSLQKMIEEDEFGSFILWGPPGSGKTTIAKYVANNTQHNFSSFSAVLSKISDVKALMEKARQLHLHETKSSIVFVDEIHRFNKAQQDAFLPYIESGAVILIGATTENPSFEVIPALLSRCHVFVLEPLSEDSIGAILGRALTFLPKRVNFEEETLTYLAQQAGGDARKAINDLELVCRNAEIGEDVTAEKVSVLLNRRTLFYDKRGEEHFNLISAFQKSIRGSDAQAALYWLARMLEAGEDPLYVTRRLVRIASEDIGLADPQALVQAVATKDAVHFLGMPEANTALSQLTVYLATAPKSNSLELAYNQAKEDARKTSHLGVPKHIRNAPTKLMKELDYGKGYRYSHNYDNNYSYQNYFPEQMQEKRYYQPSDFGFEKEVKKRLSWWEKLKKNELSQKNSSNKGEEKE